jgi:two-component system sensor histidine kinase KdpD
VDNQDDYVARFPEVAHIIRDETRSHATACLPLQVGDQVLGGLGISFPQPRTLSAHERQFLLSIADATALALERARLYDAEAHARHAAERADWLKTRFLAIVSHELRTPLTSIKGFATTLLQDDIDWDEESQRDFLQIIDSEADKLAEMIEQLLDFSRIEAGTLRMQQERTTIDAVMEFALPQLQIITKGHRLRMDLTPNLPPIHADRRRISQVLTNIIVNAVRYSPQGSVISVSTYVDRAHVRVDVADQGPGIPSEERAHVFEAFHQGANHSQGESKGAGLGLAIARGIIEAHDGRIWVEDRPDPGTLISFVLPVDLRMDDEVSEQASSEAVGPD